MSCESYRITVETLENGYKVEVPDFERIAELKARAKLKGEPMLYVGRETKSFAAKSIAEVVKLVRAHLEKLPEGEFEAAFDEATEEK